VRFACGRNANREEVLRGYTRTLGRVGVVCIPQSGGLLSTYTVRLSDLGVIVEHGTKVVFTARNN
jgi:hypothetical protein